MSERRVGDVARKVRSKNAGPFVLTIDIFCDDAAGFRTVCAALSNRRIAALFAQDVGNLRRFELDRLNVLKFSMPRPVVQGSREDRDMHASQWGWLVAELALDEDR